MDKLFSIALISTGLELGTNREGYYHTTRISLEDAEELYNYLHAVLASRIASRDRLKDELKDLEAKVVAKKKELQAL